jgi:hypothetical protein
MMTLVTFQFDAHFKVEDADPQVTATCHKLFATRMQGGTSLISKMNGHFVMLQQLVGRQIKKVNMRPGGRRHDVLLLLSTITINNIASSGSNDFQISNFVRLFGIKGMHQSCGRRNIPQVNLANSTSE